MKAYDVTMFDVARAVERVNAANGWDGNLILSADTAQSNTRRGPRSRFTLRVRNSREVPARLSQSGRHTVAASWEAHRDVMRELFAMGCSRIVTALADYRGLADFEAKYPATFWHNAGSQLYPVSFGDLTL